MKIGNLCVTRVSMGDIPIFSIPSSVTIAKVGSDYCYSSLQKCCWKGGKPESCDSPYPNCERTYCNLEAAKEICENFNFGGKTWRLPAYSELALFQQYNYGLEANGLMLCGNYGYTCNNFKCLGAKASTCLGEHVNREGGINGVGISGLSFDYAGGYYGAQVRCVSEID